MIKVTLLEGVDAGTQLVDSRMEMDPSGFFEALWREDQGWLVDYDEATEEEFFLWRPHDLAARVIRALRAGRPVFFLGQKFEAEEKEDVLEVAGNLEDAIVASDRIKINKLRMITISSDDKTGLVIGVKGYEQ